MPHIKLRFSSQSGHPDLLYSQEWVNVIFLHLWPQKLYRAFRFGALWPVSCSYPRHSQLTRHSLMLANGRIRQSLTALVEFELNLFFWLKWSIYESLSPMGWGDPQTCQWNFISCEIFIIKCKWRIEFKVIYVQASWSAGLLGVLTQWCLNEMAAI